MKGGRCAACKHPRLVEIDAALASGASERGTAVRFGLGRSSIQTHVKGGHIPSTMVVLASTEIARERRSVTEMADRLADQIETGIQQAIVGGNPMVIGAFIREMRSLLPMLAQLAPPPPPVAIDYLKSEGYTRLRAVLNAVLCPECRIALATALSGERDSGVTAPFSGSLTAWKAPIDAEEASDA